MIGNRIRDFRRKKNMTQKELGLALGFSEATAEVRITQYEKGGRKPRQELVNKMATVLGVHPYALMVPEIHTPIGVLHTLFAMEDAYGLVVNKMSTNTQLNSFLQEWEEKRVLLCQGKITREEYDKWRYNFSKEEKE